MANNANLLTEHIDIWTAAESEKKSGRGRASGNAGSIYGVKKLRKLILELAVRGKLVPQDPNNEPASELLKRIQSEKTQLIAEGKLKKENPLAPISEDEKPFELPNGWIWVRNSELFQLRKGRIPKNLNEDGLGLPYLDIDALDRNTIRRYSEDLTCPQSTDKDILVVCDGSRSGLVLDGKNGIIGSTLSIIDTPIFIQNYIKLIFKQGFDIFNTSMKGAAIPHLDTQKLLQNPTALPPLAEQLCIIAKVDELMTLCDQLEQQHSNAQEAHETLVSQLLATLTQSQNAAEFNANWQRIYDHFDVLFTTEASIDTLKQTLLQLAIIGKLVPQNPNEEPASELLKRIQAEKAKMISEGKLKKEKPLAQITDDEKLFNLPKAWEWVRLRTLATHLGDGLHGTPIYNTKGKVYFVNGNNLKDGKIVIKHETKTVDESEYEKYKKPLNETTLLVSINGTLGTVGFYSGESIVLGKSACYINLTKDMVNKHFVKILIDAPSFMEYALKNATGTTIKNLGLKAINEMTIGLPPIEEQHRIVAKVNVLMALCDQLKTRIQKGSQQKQLIADALVSQVIS